MGGGGIREERPAESEAEAMEAGMMLSDWLLLAFSAAFLNVSDPPARAWHFQEGSIPPLSISSYGHAPQTWG